MASKILLLIVCLLGVCRGASALDVAERSPSVGGSTTSLPVDSAGLGLTPRRGMLYRVTSHGKTSYLFGTVHAGSAASSALEPEVARALASSSNLVLELDIRNNAPIRAAMDKHGVYAPGDSIRNHLSLPAYRKLITALNEAGMNFSDVASYKPWVVAQLLAGAQMSLKGYQRGQAVEYYLLAAAQQQKKKVLQLESADYQLSLFNTMDDDKQESYLLENISDLKNGNAIRQSESLIDAWNHADAAKVDAIMDEISASNTVSSNFMTDTILGKRNVLMVASIENIIKDNKAAFIGIGLLHLTGPNGLPQLLRNRGYDVEKVY